jgi:hypothetical protein
LQETLDLLNVIAREGLIATALKLVQHHHLLLNQRHALLNLLAAQGLMP